VLDSPWAPVNPAERGSETSTDCYAENDAEPISEIEELGTNAGIAANGRNDMTVVELPDGQLCEISISHDSDLATAVALVPYMELKTHSGN
jgi:hypothetical protein